MLAIIDLVINLLYIIVILDVVLSWVMPNTEEFPRNLTTQVTDPLYAPIRAIISPEKLGGLDLSPLILFMILGAMRRMLHGG